MSGLVRPIMLANNGNDLLAVNQNGAFTFGLRMPNGANYSVSVATQAAGQHCSVSAASGVAAGAVSNIAVTCTIDGNNSFVPVMSTAQPNTSGGTTGLFVAATNELDRPLDLITSDPVRPFAYTSRFSIDASGFATTQAPAALLYVTEILGRENYVWKLDLSANSNYIPSRISTFSVAAYANVPHCGVFTTQKDLNDPGSAFSIIAVPTNMQYLCGGGAFKFYRVRVNDNSTTAPTELSLFSGLIEPLYSSSGLLAGLVAISSTGQLNFYADESFTNPTTLLNGAISFRSLIPRTVSPVQNLSAMPTRAFLQVMFSDGSQRLYRVSSSGAISASLHTFQSDIHSIAVDANNLYLVEAYVPQADVVERVLKVPLSGSTSAVTLYSAPQAPNSSLSLLGTTGTQLILHRALLVDPATSARSSDLRALSTVAPGMPTPIATYNDLTNVRLVGNYLLITRSTLTTSSGVGGARYASEIRRTDGTIVQSMRDNSAFSVAGITSTIQIDGITATTGYGHGGGRVYTLDFGVAAPPSVIALNGTNGAPFQIATNSSYFSAFDLYPNVGIGVDSGPVSSAVIYNLNQLKMATFSRPNSDMRVPWALF